MSHDVDTLVQLLAVLIHRRGGEIIIHKDEFEMLEGVAVKGVQITPEYLHLMLDEEGVDAIEVDDITE